MTQSCICCGATSLRKRYLLFSKPHHHLLATWELVLVAMQRKTGQSSIDSRFTSGESRPGLCPSCFQTLQGLKKVIDSLVAKVLSNMSAGGPSGESSLLHDGNSCSILPGHSTPTGSKRPRSESDSQQVESTSQPVARRLRMDLQPMSPEVDVSWKIYT